MFKLQKSILSITFLALIIFSSFFVNKISQSEKPVDYKSVQTFDWTDSWYLDTDRVTFSVYIEAANQGFVGAHCWTDQLAIGDDCALPNQNTLTNGILVNSNTLQFKFKTNYGAGAETNVDYFGVVQLKVIDSNTIEWNIIDSPVGRTPIPEHTTLKRNQDN